MGALHRGALGRRPRQNFETWSWFFMRISGLILIFLALIHFSITHIFHDVTHTDSAFVAREVVEAFDADPSRVRVVNPGIPDLPAASDAAAVADHKCELQMWGAPPLAPALEGEYHG